MLKAALKHFFQLDFRLLILVSIVVRLASPQVVAPVLVNLMKNSVKWSSPKLEDSGNVHQNQYHIYDYQALDQDKSKTSTDFVMPPGLDGIGQDLRLGEDGTKTSADSSHMDVMIGQVKNKALHILSVN